jgi:hypothetical protein
MTNDNPSIEQPNELTPELREAIAQAAGGNPAAVMVGLSDGRRVALVVDAKDYQYVRDINAYASPCGRCGQGRRWVWDGQELDCEDC